MLISFEGIEAVGKTTQIKLLEEFLKKKSYSVSIYREPGGTSLGNKVRSLVKDTKNMVSAEAELLLFSASRAQLIKEEIEPNMNKCDYIILDRFFDSSLAYQGWGRNLDLEFIHELNKFVTRGLKPDKTFFLDLPVEHSLERIKKRGELDKIELEKREFHERVYQGFKKIVQSEERFICLDALEEEQEIHKKIISHLGCKNL